MSTGRIPALLEPIQNRLNAATPGPWAVMDVNDPGEGVNYIDVYAETDGLETVCKMPNPADYSMREYLQQDADFIANAPTDQARLLAAVQAVTGLHKVERRYLQTKNADRSFDTAEEALAACRAHSMEGYEIPYYANVDEIPFFEVCAHCKTVEDGPCDGQCTREAGTLWPCPTVAAVVAALGGAA